MTPERKAELRAVCNALLNPTPLGAVYRELLDALDEAEAERDRLQAERDVALEKLDEQIKIRSLHDNWAAEADVLVAKYAREHEQDEDGPLHDLEEDVSCRLRAIYDGYDFKALRIVKHDLEMVAKAEAERDALAARLEELKAFLRKAAVTAAEACNSNTPREAIADMLWDKVYSLDGAP